MRLICILALAYVAYANHETEESYTACCQAYTAECMACNYAMTVTDYCAMYSTTPGCSSCDAVDGQTGYDCDGMNLPMCLSTYCTECTKEGCCGSDAPWREGDAGVCNVAYSGCDCSSMPVTSEEDSCGDDDWACMWDYSSCGPNKCGEGWVTRTRACDGSMDAVNCPECGFEQTICLAGSYPPEEEYSYEEVSDEGKYDEYSDDMYDDSYDMCGYGYYYSGGMCYEICSSPNQYYMDGDCHDYDYGYSDDYSAGCDYGYYMMSGVCYEFCPQSDQYWDGMNCQCEYGEKDTWGYCVSNSDGGNNYYSDGGDNYYYSDGGNNYYSTDPTTQDSYDYGYSEDNYDDESNNYYSYDMCGYGQYYMSGMCYDYCQSDQYWDGMQCHCYNGAEMNWMGYCESTDSYDYGYSEDTTYSYDYGYSEDNYDESTNYDSYDMCGYGQYYMNGGCYDHCQYGYYYSGGMCYEQCSDSDKYWDGNMCQCYSGSQDMWGNCYSTYSYDYGYSEDNTYSYDYGYSEDNTYSYDYGYSEDNYDESTNYYSYDMCGYGQYYMSGMCYDYCQSDQYWDGMQCHCYSGEMNWMGQCQSTYSYDYGYSEDNTYSDNCGSDQWEVNGICYCYSTGMQAGPWGCDSYTDSDNADDDDCVEFTVTTVPGYFPQEGTWNIGNCEGNLQTFSTTCCLSDGYHTLTCDDSYGDGWNGGSVTFLGNTYCTSNFQHSMTDGVTIDAEESESSEEYYEDESDGGYIWTTDYPDYSYTTDYPDYSDGDMSYEEMYQTMMEMESQLEYHEERITNLESQMGTMNNFMSCASSSSSTDNGYYSDYNDYNYYSENYNYNYSW